MHCFDNLTQQWIYKSPFVRDESFFLASLLKKWRFGHFALMHFCFLVTCDFSTLNLASHRRGGYWVSRTRDFHPALMIWSGDQKFILKESQIQRMPILQLLLVLLTFKWSLFQYSQHTNWQQNGYILIRAGKTDFWKSISKAAAQGALNRFYPPCIVNAASDVLDG